LNSEEIKLYLICPDCQIENAIRHKFGNDAYFLTALGSVFDISEFEYAEEVNQFINKEIIKEIIIVNDFDCTFIINAIKKQGDHNTKAEKELLLLQNTNISEFRNLDYEEQKITLVKLNICRQAYALLDVAFIGNKIKDGSINVNGLIYNRKMSFFEKIILKL